jgi:hypothetical protein
MTRTPRRSLLPRSFVSCLIYGTQKTPPRAVVSAIRITVFSPFGNAGRSLLKSARERLLMRLLFDNGCSSLVSEAAQGRSSTLPLERFIF